MKYEGEVTGLQSDGLAATVKLQNVRLKSSATWQDYSPSASFLMPLSRAKAFPLGRRVRVTVVPLD